jgi:hypothetical protein
MAVVFGANPGKVLPVRSAAAWLGRLLLRRCGVCAVWLAFSRGIRYLVLVSWLVLVHGDKMLLNAGSSRVNPRNQWLTLRNVVEVKESCSCEGDWGCQRGSSALICTWRCSFVSRPLTFSSSASEALTCAELTAEWRNTSHRPVAASRSGLQHQELLFQVSTLDTIGRPLCYAFLDPVRHGA